MPILPGQATYRILDASINRATEGLRTLEEYARFAQDDAAASGCFKSLRHDLTTAVGDGLDRQRLIQSRDTPGDVGTEIRESTEYKRSSSQQVIAAAAARIAQSLRVIEEYGKTIDARFAAQIEQIRYRAYQACATLELAAFTNTRVTQLAEAKLYLLIDGGESETQFTASIEQLAKAGVDIFQLRDHSLDDRTLYERACVGAAAARKHGRLFIVNDRADIAAAADADGVHVGQEELPAAAARAIIGDRRLLGISTHSIQQAKEAVDDGADYIGCGPVFAGRTKQFDAYVGPAFLQQVTQSISIPAFAIGGIDQSNVSEIIAAGCDRIAVTGAIRDAEDPVHAAKKLKQSLRWEEPNR
ncbi:Thiamine-phosphate pyrophosphorylase, predicted, cyanobacteria [Rhodopirellula maiorica SM1]|uniref:Thiamine-phosphate synthase n=1 Tax=Rhodopirellula maiorica SM1 TaxID=1265738 RepID=M5S390_9BACT|nr:thiamine phosphate synthase [Rhodopirellula maiorica]EMI22102.1 Thiamine-phosphate pyrophosphorylase, predicted, cyanobacteria [Rhodopirellula maiorica SM1]